MTHFALALNSSLDAPQTAEPATLNSSTNFIRIFNVRSEEIFFLDHIISIA